VTIRGRNSHDQKKGALSSPPISPIAALDRAKRNKFVNQKYGKSLDQKARIPKKKANQNFSLKEEKGQLGGEQLYSLYKEKTREPK
jgi:hypothetical protein